MSDNSMARFWWTVREYPIGPLLLAATGTGLVTVAFHADETTAARTLRRLADRLDAEPTESQEEDVAAGQSVDALGSGGPEVLIRTTDELDTYFAGTLREFSVPLDWSLASAFHTRVLTALAHTVRYGQVTGYQDLAQKVGEPGAARAVGVAMGANPLPVVVPCHRVVESGGGIGGFGGGLETKRALLALEGVLPPPLFD